MYDVLLICSGKREKTRATFNSGFLSHFSLRLRSGCVLCDFTEYHDEMFRVDSVDAEAQ